MGKNVFMAVIIKKFKFIQGYVKNYFNDQLPVGLLTQLIRGLYQYHTGQGLNPSKAEIFRLSFCNCLRCVFQGDDLLFIYLVRDVLVKNHF